ncbi:DUF1403 family protein [Mesorhizobium sp. M1339]
MGRCLAAAPGPRGGGRAEDEAALRDAVFLTRPGDDVGPAGRMLLAWRKLAARPAEKLLTEGALTELLNDLGLARDDEALGDLADGLRQLALRRNGRYAGRRRRGRRAAWRCAHRGILACYTLLAQKLGWQYAVPLLGTETFLGMSARPRRSATSSPVTGIETETERAKALVAAQARAALRAIDLLAGLERRADRLLAVAPKLRAKGADTSSTDC